MNKNLNPSRIANQTIFGEAKRFCLVEFYTRYGTTTWFVKDAEQPDENGYSTVVFQAETKEAALARFGYAETDIAGIVPAARG
jgi:phosphoketolase